MRSYLCGKHFNTDDYRYSTNSMRLKDEAISRIFDFPDWASMWKGCGEKVSTEKRHG